MSDLIEEQEDLNLSDAVYCQAQNAVEYIANSSDEEIRQYLAVAGLETDEEIRELIAQEQHIDDEDELNLSDAVYYVAQDKVAHIASGSDEGKRKYLAEAGIDSDEEIRQLLERG